MSQYHIELKCQPYDISTFSTELRGKLSNCGIRVVATTRRAALDAGMSTWIMAMAINERTLIVISDDLKRPGLEFTAEEIESMIWHEVGHFRLNTADEKMADEYAMTHCRGGQETWMSAMVKTWAILCYQKPSKQYSWSGNYQHRNYWIRLFLLQHKMNVPKWL